MVTTNFDSEISTFMGCLLIMGEIWNAHSDIPINKDPMTKVSFPLYHISFAYTFGIFDDNKPHHLLSINCFFCKFLLQFYLFINLLNVILEESASVAAFQS